jgi:hypothetical protein
MPLSIIPVGAHTIYAETLPMFIPAGGAHVRQVFFNLPKLQPNPTVVATTYSNQSPGNAFAIWDITIAQEPNQTVIKVSATNVEKGFAVPFDYFCGIVVVGQPAK